MDRAQFLKATLLAPMLLAGGAAGAAHPADGFDGFIDLFYRQKKVRKAFEDYVAEDYVQHSVGIGQGREAAIAVLEPMFGRENFLIEPVRVLREADLVIVVLDVRVGDAVRALVVDLFRHAGGKIREHWDVKLEIPEGQREHYFDGMRRHSAG